MNPLYNAGISLYGFAARLVALRSPKVRRMLDGQARTIATLQERRTKAAPGGFDVWFHAASLGEFEQARPLIERIKRETPEKTVLLTFFSPSGYDVRHDYQLADAVVYLPFDTPRRVRRFLDAAAPRMAIFVKYEFWGNYLTELHRRGIPTYIISAIFRRRQRFFRRTSGAMWRQLLRCYNHLYVQDANSRRLLGSIGITDVTVAGDTRFDRVTDIMRSRTDIPEVAQFTAGSPFTLIAGSSWPADEDCYIPWLKDNPEVRAIIAPHEFDDCRLAALRNRLGDGATLLSEYNAAPSADARYLIIDCFGLLCSIYRYGNAAYIGGGFGAGIHNLNEAAVYDIPVVFGPNNKKFKEAAGLAECGGGFCVTSPVQCSAVLTSLKQESAAASKAGHAAGEYIRAHIGASEIIYNDLFKL